MKNTLPDLPRVLNKREASFGIQFRRYLEKNPMPSSAFELKATTKKSIPFSCLKDHQISYLLSTKKKSGLLWKIADDSKGIKCFDYFYLRNAYAFVVIKYPSSFHIIDVETFILEKGRSKRKSLTEDRAKAISTVSVAIGKTAR